MIPRRYHGSGIGPNVGALELASLVFVVLAILLVH